MKKTGRKWLFKLQSTKFLGHNPSVHSRNERQFLRDPETIKIIFYKKGKVELFGKSYKKWFKIRIDQPKNHKLLPKFRAFLSVGNISTTDSTFANNYLTTNDFKKSEFLLLFRVMSESND